MADEKNAQVSEGKMVRDISECKNVFLAKESTSPNNIGYCMIYAIEAIPGISIYDKKDNKNICFTSHNIEVIANAPTFLDNKINMGSLNIIIKYRDLTAEQTVPDVTLQEKNTSYSNISDLIRDYEALNKKIEVAHAKKKRVKLTNWGMVED